jgi:hypothetical protein
VRTAGRMPCASSRSSTIAMLRLVERLGHELGRRPLVRLVRVVGLLQHDDRVDEPLLRAVVQVAHHPPAFFVGGGYHTRARRAQFGRPFGHLHFEFVSGFAKLVFSLPALVDEACAPKCCCGVIRGDGKQHQVNLGRKVGATAGRRNETALGIDTDGNDSGAAWLHAAADVRNDLLS